MTDREAIMAIRKILDSERDRTLNGRGETIAEYDKRRLEAIRKLL